jgi:hypothetical protein
LTGLYSAPARDDGKTANNYNLFKSTSSSVPDGGTTAALLGLALLGTAVIHRKVAGNKIVVG